MQSIWLFFVIASFSFQALCAEYVYPINYFNDGDSNKVMLIHQSVDKHMNLWSFNLSSSKYERLLSAQFNPMGVQLLPDGTGFGFLNNGIIKVKEFSKRSPRTVELDEPLCNVSVVRWIDAHTCYLHAQKKLRGRFGVYLITDHGHVSSLFSHSQRDYLYPYMVESTLFCIERHEDRYKVITLDNEGKQEVIIDFDTQAIMFLHMINSNEGFVIGCPSNLDDENELVMFDVYHIEKYDNSWDYEKLFSFFLPLTIFLNNNNSLCEGFYPLMPSFLEKRIYFHSVEQNSPVEPMYYDIEKRSIFCVPHDHFFCCPFQKNDALSSFPFSPISVNGETWLGNAWVLTHDERGKAENDALAAAAREGSMSDVRDALDAGANNFGDAVLLASKYGHYGIVSHILARFPVSTRVLDGALNAAVSNGYQEVIRVLVIHQYGNRDPYGSAFIAAARILDVQVLTYFLTHYAHVITSDVVGTCLIDAVQSNRFIVVQKLVAKAKNKLNYFALTESLGIAAANNNLAMVKALFEVHPRYPLFTRPLVFAAQGGSLRIVEYLFYRMADPIKKGDIKTALASAQKWGRVLVVGYLKKRLEEYA